ncbi:MAG: hypothetical protein KJO01_07320 [Gammaproteobacteria bacterium]|nr:hypothetical protein [Gammaproteobacteria bacterium]MBT8111935.1 hypothetical protein [Gammaproteobacteria bacterium]NND47954.1 hypothetical protein [Woeseiaceae bacterium]NNL46634.1 hypothetical protein [Woeseiaceae bacterium]
MGLLAKLNGNPRTATKTTKIKYRGVQVVVDKNDCCQAALPIADKRFLIEQIPKLPLADCDAARCNCAYERFDDRRADFRRASDVAFDMASQLHDDDSRSSTSSGRRGSD